MSTFRYLEETPQGRLSLGKWCYRGNEVAICETVARLMLVFMTKTEHTS